VKQAWQRAWTTGSFDGNAAISAMFGHILAVGEVKGTYSLNPAVK
jgi:hypothetical protein